MFYVLLVLFVADRCIQNIYRQLRQDAGAPKKYPGVLANLLMLDKLSIEDIKASVTELMAGGVDTVRDQMMMLGCRRVNFFSSFSFKAFPCFCLSDLYYAAVDIV